MKKLLFVILILISSNIFGQGRLYVLNTTYGNPVNTRFNYTVNNTSGQSPDQNLNIFAYVIPGWYPSIDWGDGATGTRSGDSLNYTFNHVYSTTGTFINTVYITGDSSLVRQVDFNANSASSTVTSINNITYFSKLVTFILKGVSITSLNNLIYPSTLTTLSVISNPILTGFDPATNLPAGLTSLTISACGGGTSAGTGVFPYFHPTKPLPATLTTITLTSNNWDSTAVNNTLIYLNGQTFNGPVNINVKQYNANSAPTGAGKTAENALIAKGDGVITD